MSDDVGMQPEVIETPVVLETETKAAPERQEITSSDLQKMLEQERRRTREAEIRARQAQEELRNERVSRRGDVEARWESDVTAAKTAHAAATSDADRLQAEAEVHLSEGRWAEGMKAMRLAARAEAEATNWKQREDWLTKNKDMMTAPREETRQQSASAPRSDEVQIDWSQYSARQRAWLEDHPDYMKAGNKGQAYRNRVAALHYEALEAGCSLDSNDYFNFIDERLGGKTSRQEPQGEGAQRPASMPVQRGTGPRAPAPSNRSAPVSLSALEREAADAALPDVPAQDYRDKDGNVQPGRYRIYVEQKQRLKTEGRLH